MKQIAYIYNVKESLTSLNKFKVIDFRKCYFNVAFAVGKNNYPGFKDNKYVTVRFERRVNQRLGSSPLLILTLGLHHLSTSTK